MKTVVKALFVLCALVVLSSQEVDARGKRKNKGGKSKSKGKGGKSKSKKGSLDIDRKSFRCQLTCSSDQSHYISAEEKQSWSKTSDEFYNVLSHDHSYYPGLQFNQSFTMARSWTDRKSFHGQVWDKHQPNENPLLEYHNGYPLEKELYNLDEDGNAPDGNPGSFYFPPLGFYDVVFKSETEYYGIGRFQKPGFPPVDTHTCRFGPCVLERSSLCKYQEGCDEGLFDGRR